MRKLTAGTLLWLVATQPAMAQGEPVLSRSLGAEVGRTLIWCVIAGVAFTLAFKIVDWTTPGDLKQQLAEGNVALAIYVGSLAISSAIIIAALVG